jgi:hypothetical protein
VHLAYFTERPYRYAPQDQLIEKGFFGTPNSVFDPAKGHELYHEYLDEKVLCEETGFDGVCLNEHHATPFTMGGVMDVEASIAAFGILQERQQRRARWRGTRIGKSWGVKRAGRSALENLAGSPG